jgi:hypothetical protein
MRDNEPESQANDGEPDPTKSWGTNGSGPVSSDLPADAATETAAADATADDNSAFLADLARVMQAAASAERIRISEDSERRRTAHLEVIRARETAQADELRVLSEGDVKAIDSWADSEIERIQSERERRTVSRRAELSQRLEDHRLLIGREVDAVEAAIASYRTEVEAYFSRLDGEVDPVVIAQAAGSRPTFPALDTIGPDRAPVDVSAPSTADADAADDGEPPLIGDAGLVAVMDPEAGDSSAEAASEPAVEATGHSIEDGGEAATTAEVGPVSSGEPVPGVEAGTEPGQSVETTAQSNVVAPRSSAALLRAVPTARPMGSWFRRDGGAGGPSETDD